ncbi:MAG: zinc ribbon domain-containing protein [Acidobacteria bacterium]|nr:zinc ribbon domain-containing protein [Acidobacteriota bacterium]
MAGYCTCGAKLPEDARFCHKCGRPLYELVPPEAEEQPVQRPVEPQSISVPLPGERPQISFRNPTAVRVGLLTAALMCILFPFAAVMPLGPFFQLLLLLGGGFWSVWVYNRRSHVFLTPAHGMRLGWIAGLFAFVIAVVLFTISMIGLSMGPGLGALRDLLAEQGNAEMLDEAVRFLQSPAGIVMVLFVNFFFLTLLPALGGALGAKVLEKE